MNRQNFEFVVTKTGPASDLPKLAYSPKEAAEVVSLSRAFLYNEWSAGRGPKKIKIGRRTLITDEALREWLRSLQHAD
jgi:predicted DNA-binding transcriptional regulator AlpA